MTNNLITTRVAFQGKSYLVYPTGDVAVEFEVHLKGLANGHRRTRHLAQFGATAKAVRAIAKESNPAVHDPY